MTKAKKVTSFDVSSYVKEPIPETRFMIIKQEISKKTGVCNIKLEVSSYTPIYENGKVRKQRKQKRFATPYFAKPEWWSVKKGRAKHSYDFHEDLNAKLDKYHTAVKDFYRTSMSDPTGTYTLGLPEALKKLEKTFRKRKTLIDWIAEYIEYRRKNTKVNTLKGFIWLKNVLLEFQETYTPLYFESMTFEFATAFKAWSASEAKDPNTTKKHLKRLCTILNHYYPDRVKLNITLTDEFKQKRFIETSGTHDSEPSPLYIDEVRKVENWEPKKLMGEYWNNKKKVFEKKYFSLEVMLKIKQLFLIGCYSGLRYSDVMKIRPATIVNGKISMTPTKTTKYEIKVAVPIIDDLRAILETIGYDTSTIEMSSQRVNRGLTLMLKDIGLDTPTFVYTYTQNNDRTETQVPKYEAVSFHSSRDSFITNALIAGTPTHVVMKFSGHVKPDTLRKYVALSELYLSEQGQILKDYYNNYKQLATFEKAS